MGAPMKARTKRPKLALLLAGIVLLSGCAKEDKYEVLSATRETRKTATDEKDVTVFKLKHGRTIITASCQHYVDDVAMKCAELVVGNSYALRRIRRDAINALLFRLPEEKTGGAVLTVEGESVQ
jgi:PBP1b-binding outer membrane lipoprotein LpoB